MKWLSVLVIGLCYSGGIMAATVWAPTDVDRMVRISLKSASCDAVLGLFDDEDQTFSSSALLLKPLDKIVFTQTDSEFIATNLRGAGNSISLSDSFSFILALSLDGGMTWVSESDWFSLKRPNNFKIAFGNDDLVKMNNVQVVPLPAAVWLFFSALLSLIHFSRRKSFRITPSFVQPLLKIRNLISNYHI